MLIHNLKSNFKIFYVIQLMFLDFSLRCFPKAIVAKFEKINLLFSAMILIITNDVTMTLKSSLQSADSIDNPKRAVTFYDQRDKTQ